MPQLSNQNPTASSSGIPRRAVLGASAVAVPAIVMTASSPAVAASGQKMSIVLSPSSVVAGGTSSVVVTVKSAAGTAVVGQAVTLSAAAGVSFSPSTGVTQSDGTFRSTLTVASTRAAGTVTISAVVSGANASAALSVKTVAVAVAVSPSSSVRGDSATVTATVKDSSGAVLAGRAVTLSTSRSGVSFAAASGTTNASGQFSTTVRSTTATAAGVATLTASSSGASGNASWTMLGVKVAVAVSPSSIGAGGASTVTATVTDSNGAPLANRTVSWGTTYSKVGLKNASGTTNAAGQVQTTLQTRGNTPVGAGTVSASSLGASGSGAFTVSTPTLAISAPPEIGAGGNATISLSGWPGRDVTVTNSGSGIGYPNGPTAIFAANGSASVVVSVSNAAVPSVTFTATSWGLVASTTARVGPAGSAGAGGTRLDLATFTDGIKPSRNQVVDALLFDVLTASGTIVPSNQYQVLVPNSAPSGFGWFALNARAGGGGLTGGFRAVSAGQWLVGSGAANEFSETLALRRLDGAAFNNRSVPTGSGSDYITAKSRTGAAFSYSPAIGLFAFASGGAQYVRFESRVAWV